MVLSVILIPWVFPWLSPDLLLCQLLKEILLGHFTGGDFLPSVRALLLSYFLSSSSEVILSSWVWFASPSFSKAEAWFRSSVCLQESAWLRRVSAHYLLSDQMNAYTIDMCGQSAVKLK